MKSEYYLIMPFYKKYRNSEIYATVLPFKLDLNIQLSLRNPIPIDNFPVITFSFFELNPPNLDYLLTDGSYILITKKLMDLLKNNGVIFTSYPARIIGNLTGKELNLDYYIFHPLDVIEGVDWEESDIPMNSIQISKVVLKKGIMLQNKPLIRLADFGGHILINKELKKVLITQGITGCSYKNLIKYSSWKGFDTSSVDNILKQRDIK